MTRIAIEATGCDEGFLTVLKGAKKVSEKNKNLELILIAGKDKLPKEYCNAKNLTNKIYLEQTEFTYEPRDKNKQQKSSIYKAIEMHKSREVEAVIAPGDTRGTIYYSWKILSYMPRIVNPGIPTHWPRNNVLIDSGATIECTRENLLQFAIMGTIYSKNYLKVEKPLIGILTNGKERTKGNELVKRGRKLINKKLKDKEYNISEEYFEGDFIEDLDAGKVVVTDGHTGNVFLKGCESALKKAFSHIYEEIKKQNWALQALAYIGTSGPLKKIKKELRYEEYATAPLLGVKGNVMICHGRSDVETIANAIRITEKYLRCDINSKLEEEIVKSG